MSAIPLLSDIQPVRYEFHDGDRVLSRVSVDLTKDQYQRVERAVKKFTRAEVRVLIVNQMKVRILHHRFGGAVTTLVEPALNESAFGLGVANLDCSVVDLNPNDTLVVQVPFISSDFQRQTIKDWIQRWAGKEVEVVVSAQGI